MLAWRKGFYGYVIAASAFSVYLLLGGCYYGLSVLAPVMADDLGWSATASGAAFSIFAILVGLSSPLAGAFVVRFGPRLSILIGSISMATALALLSTTTAIWQLYAFVILLGVGMALGVTLPLQQLVGNWFVIRRSLFLGLVLTGAGVGGLVITSLTSSLVGALGSWRTVWLVLAGVTLLPGLLALFFIRNRPEELGQKADGATHDQNLQTGAPAQRQASRVHKTKHQWEVKAAIRTPAFWLVSVSNGIMFFLLQATTAHQVAYLTSEAGMELGIAASALGLIAGSSIIGRLVAGWLGDRMEPRFVIAGLHLLLGLSLLILISGQGLVTLYVYVVLFGIGYGGMIVLAPTTMLNYFGSMNYAAIMGIASPTATVLGAVSPLLVGGIKDGSGSYLPAFVLMMGFTVVGAVCAFLARPPAREAAGTAQVDLRDVAR
ncbi:MAG: MFS transporter [Chloroflexota bacterium]|nr:MFS transporter [Chloroflexota bacterium]